MAPAIVFRRSSPASTLPTKPIAGSSPGWDITHGAGNTGREYPGLTSVLPTGSAIVFFKRSAQFESRQGTSLRHWGGNIHGKVVPTQLPTE